jgi:excisionase family DNA binding protein
MTTEYVPIDDVAKSLHVSPATVRVWVRRGDIPPNTYIRVGTTYRFNLDAVVNALRGPEKNVDEIPYVQASHVGKISDNLDEDI